MFEECTVTRTDQWGCPVTTDESETAVIDQAIVEFVTMSPAIIGSMGRLEAGGARSKTVLATLLTLSHRPAMVAKAEQLLAAARADADRLNQREQCHLRAASYFVETRSRAASDAMADAVARHPTDLFALQMRYLALFSTGRLPEMVALVPAVRAAWADDLPLASYLDGMEAFALEESGRYDRAEELGRAGVAADPGDLWAIHSVAHVLEMQQRRDEGVAWLDAQRPVLGGGGFAGHLWWHQAIQLWALGRHDDVLRLFDESVYPGSSSEGLDLTNAASLLLRVESSGIDVGDRWARLTEGAAARLGRHSHPFNDTHHVLALTRAGEVDRARELLAGMRAWSSGDDDAADVLRRVGLALGEGVLAYGTGRWASAVGHLAPVADDWWRMGGSKAQRFFYATVLDDARRRQAA